MSLPGRFIGGWSGVMVEDVGYRDFFAWTAVISLPAIVIAIYLAQRERRRDSRPAVP